MPDYTEKEFVEINKFEHRALCLAFPANGRQADVGGAVAVLREGIRKYPDSYLLNERLFFALCKQGKSSEGIEYLVSLAEKFPDDLDVQGLLLQGYVAMEDPQYHKKARALAGKLSELPLDAHGRAHLEAYIAFMERKISDLESRTEFEPE